MSGESISNTPVDTGSMQVSTILEGGGESSMSRSLVGAGVFPSFGVSTAATDSEIAHGLRLKKLRSLGAFPELEAELVGRFMDSETGTLYLGEDQKRETFDGTQFAGEHHRLLTPVIQEIFADPGARKALMDSIDKAAEDGTERLVYEASKSQDGTVKRDLVIIGSGSHGVQAATLAKQMYPDLSVLILDREPQIGGQPRQYGPNHAFSMNSRVRKEDRRLSPIPRTPGSINPMGDYAPLQFSDVVKGNYATNVEWGQVNAVNAYLSAGQLAVGAEASDLGFDLEIGRPVVNANYAGTNVTMARIVTRGVIIARGIEQSSTLQSNNLSLDHEDTPNYWTTRDVYQHFGNADRNSNNSPLEVFANKTVAVIGGGDSALTALEALLGNLDSESYGKYGPGRFRPQCIVWFGAPGTTAQEIDACLRSRYKNGIIQALPKNIFDEGSIIDPIISRATSIEPSSFINGLFVRIEGGGGLSVDHVFDCTNDKAQDPAANAIQSLDLRLLPLSTVELADIGPGARPQLDEETLEIIEGLGIGENTVALWALMRQSAMKSLRIIECAASRGSN